MIRGQELFFNFLIVITILLSAILSGAQPITLEKYIEEYRSAILCNYEIHPEEIYIVDGAFTNRHQCTGDVIWGLKNVCYVGDSQNLIQKINSNAYYWEFASLMKDAWIESDGTTVTYEAADRWGLGRKNITPCNHDFFAGKEIVNLDHQPKIK